MATNLVDASKITRVIDLDISYNIILPIIINSDSGLLYELSETVSFTDKQSLYS